MKSILFLLTLAPALVWANSTRVYRGDLPGGHLQASVSFNLSPSVQASADVSEAETMDSAENFVHFCDTTLEFPALGTAQITLTDKSTGKVVEVYAVALKPGRIELSSDLGADGSCTVLPMTGAGDTAAVQMAPSAIDEVTKIDDGYFELLTSLGTPWLSYQLKLVGNNRYELTYDARTFFPTELMAFISTGRPTAQTMIKLPGQP